MVVRQHHAGSTQQQGPRRHFARINAGLVERAGEQRFHADQAVLGIEKQHGKAFVRFVGQMHLHIMRRQFRVAEVGALLQLLCHRAAGQFHHGQQFGSLGAAAQTLEGFELCGIGRQQTRQAVAVIEHILGHEQHVPASGAGAQHDGQQFGVTQACRAARQQLFAWKALCGQVVQSHGGVG